jgi:hypothetical protein
MTALHCPSSPVPHISPLFLAAGTTSEFIINGMHCALEALGHPAARRPGLFTYDPVVNHKLQQASREGLPTPRRGGTGGQDR